MDEAAIVAAVAQGLERWAARLGRQFGPLSRPQRRMLTVVAAAGTEIRVGDLAARLGLTMPGTTRMIDTLEAQHYVRRVRAAGVDQRQVHVALTAAGRAALQEADRVFQERVRATIAVLDATERVALADLLARIDAASDPSPTATSLGAAGGRRGQ